MKNIIMKCMAVTVMLCSIAGGIHADSITYGDALQSRASLDSWYGLMLIYDSTMKETGQTDGYASTFSFMTHSTVTTSRSVTPLIFEQVNDSYVVRGIGASRTVSSPGMIYTYNFDVWAGSNFMGDDYTFGFIYASFSISGESIASKTVSYPAITFDSTGSSWHWYGSPSGEGLPDPEIGFTLYQAGSGEGYVYYGSQRTYSAQMHVINTSSYIPPDEPVSATVPEPASIVLFSLALGAFRLTQRK